MWTLNWSWWSLTLYKRITFQVMRNRHCLLSSLLLVVLLCKPSLQWQQGLTGVFPVQPANGQHTCNYMECRKPGGGPRLFQVRCVNGASTYGCVYKGNPHGCGNTYNGNQAAFYAALATKSGNGKENGCSFWKLWHDSCPGAVFEKVVPEQGFQSPAPEWCPSVWMIIYQAKARIWFKIKLFCF